MPRPEAKPTDRKPAEAPIQRSNPHHRAPAPWWVGGWGAVHLDLAASRRCGGTRLSVLDEPWKRPHSYLFKTTLLSDWRSIQGQAPRTYLDLGGAAGHAAGDLRLREHHRRRRARRHLPPGGCTHSSTVDSEVVNEVSHSLTGIIWVSILTGRVGTCPQQQPSAATHLMRAPVPLPPSR